MKFMIIKCYDLKWKEYKFFVEKEMKTTEIYKKYCIMDKQEIEGYVTAETGGYFNGQKFYKHLKEGEHSFKVFLENLYNFLDKKIVTYSLEDGYIRVDNVNFVVIKSDIVKDVYKHKIVAFL